MTNKSFQIVFPFLLPDKPSAPEGPIEFADLKADSVTLTWKPSASDGGSPIKEYIVERKDTRKTSWTKVASVDAKSALSCTAQKLLEDVPYLFRVIAVNEEGQSPPLEADKEIVPKAPAGEWGNIISTKF